ncbi:MAG: hypothetical protein KC766_09510 [Myxococcales bacterium]|nr:hypothetical protein [Myxococcales bacterium]
MKLLVDTDAFCKLQMAGLLDEAVGLLAAGLHECGRLPALPHMLRRGRLRRLFGADVCDAMIPVADAVPVMHQPNVTWLDKLAPIEAIDPGEAQIFAAAAEAGLIVLSGDKRALRALKGVDGFADALAGRVVVLEAILLALCDHLGLDAIRQRVAPLAVADQAVRVCFSVGNADPAAALRSYLGALQTEAHPLVLWKPRE